MRKGLTLLEALIVIAVIGMLMGLLIPAIHKIRESALILRSHNNLRQIALGLHNLAVSNNDRLPGCVWSEPPYRYETLVELLPYLEQHNLYDRYANPPPRGRALNHYTMQVATFVNPLDASGDHPNPTVPTLLGKIDPSRLSVSSYALNAQFFAFYPRITRITDGTSHTIWLTEHYGWNCKNVTFIYTIGTAVGPHNSWSPVQPATFAHGGAAAGRPTPGDYYPMTTGNPPVSTAEGGKTFQVRPKVSECDPRLPNASSSRGLQVAMAGGNVRILAPSTSPQVFWGMVTPNGGEIVSFD